MSFLHANDTAMGDSAYERRELDFYETPRPATEAAIRTLTATGYLPPRSWIWEPAAGNGAMVAPLVAAGHRVTASDIVQRNEELDWVGDFLACPVPPSYTSQTQPKIIFTNPPFGDDAEKFIRHALKLTEPLSGTVVMLLRNEYDCSKSRADLFTHSAFAMKIVLTFRPRWIENSTGAPRHNYSFYVWSWKKHAGIRATIRYAGRT